MIIEEIIKYNEVFVASKGYEKYLTSKYPDKKLAILSGMGTRLAERLPAALGLKNGDATIKVTLNRQTVDGVVYKPELYSIGGGYDYYEVEMKKLFY